MQINGVEQHSEQFRKSSTQQWILKKTERRIYYHRVVSDWMSNLLKHFLLDSLSHIKIQYHYLYAVNYKAVNTYHQVFCYPESVNTKPENLMIYGMNFTKCICTGYCES